MRKIIEYRIISGSSVESIEKGVLDLMEEPEEWVWQPSGSLVCMVCPADGVTIPGYFFAQPMVCYSEESNP